MLVDLLLAVLIFWAAYFGALMVKSFVGWILTKKGIL